MEKEEMDTFVLCLGKKGATSRLAKEMAELSSFCPDKKSGDRYGLPSSMNVLAELGESVPAILDQKVCKIFLFFRHPTIFLQNKAPQLKQGRFHGESEGANFSQESLTVCILRHAACHSFNSGASLCTLSVLMLPIFFLQVLSVIEKYESEIEYLFFSDQYSPKVDDTQKDKQLKRPEPARILQFCFNCTSVSWAFFSRQYFDFVSLKSTMFC